MDAETETLIPTIGGVFDVAQPIAFQSVDHGADASVDLSPTIRRHDPMAVAQPTTQYGSVAGSLTARHDSSPCADRGANVVAHSMAVRRLTPVECERLQGFSDNYTNIPWRKSPESPDGPRYKALGNSMAVPCMRWIGERINRIRLMTEVA
jgi:DNA (cytosine-5)-methyltransferase 1